ncbi:MAG: hypothetical protein U0939_27060 [Pirellulales bacterium]
MKDHPKHVRPSTKVQFTHFERHFSILDGQRAGAADKAGQMKAAAARNREQEIAASRDRLTQAQGRLCSMLYEVAPISAVNRVLAASAK